LVSIVNTKCYEHFELNGLEVIGLLGLIGQLDYVTRLLWWYAVWCDWCWRCCYCRDQCPPGGYV